MHLPRHREGIGSRWRSEKLQCSQLLQLDNRVEDASLSGTNRTRGCTLVLKAVELGGRKYGRSRKEDSKGAEEESGVAEKIGSKDGRKVGIELIICIILANRSTPICWLKMGTGCKL